MPDSHVRYSVVLKADIPLLERELLRQYCHEVHGDDGTTLLQLRCATLDLAHTIYLEATVILPRSQERRHLHLPHALVMLIDRQGTTSSPELPEARALPER